MKHAVWAARADADLSRLYRFYARYDVIIADRIADTIVEKCNWLAAYPAAGSPLGRSKRKSLVAATRHLIVYRSEDDGIRVLRIYHESQNWR